MEQVINDIIKVFVAQTHSAVKVSEIICEHSDRDIMKRRSLQYPRAPFICYRSTLLEGPFGRGEKCRHLRIVKKRGA